MLNHLQRITLKKSMKSLSFCDYSNAYTLLKGTITVKNTAAADVKENDTNKKVMFENCVSFTRCTSRINHTQIDDVQYIDVIMPMYNLIEYSDNYSKTSGILFQ